MDKKKFMALAALALTITGAVLYSYRMDIAMNLRQRELARQIGPNVPVNWQSGPAQAAQTAAERPPNIVFILADDLGINDISTFGGGVADGAVPTPNIDRLAKQGALFSQSYAGHATCAPSRAMLMTGRYPTRTGFEFTPTRPGFGRLVAEFSAAIDSGLPLRTFDPEIEAGRPPYNEMGLPVEEVTIAEVLKQRGYHNVHIGKWHLGGARPFHPIDQGFNESLLMESLLHLPEGDPDVVNAKLDFDPIDKTLWKISNFSTSYNAGPKFAPGGYLSDYWTDEALKVIEANKNRPFFLYLAHWGVHTPLQATRADYEAVGDIKPHRLRVYAAMVRALDRSVGRVMNKLEAEGLADNTIFVFSSDNGGANYLGLPDVNNPYRGWKLTFLKAVYGRRFSSNGRRALSRKRLLTRRLPILTSCRLWPPPPMRLCRRVWRLTGETCCLWPLGAEPFSAIMMRCSGNRAIRGSCGPETGNCIMRASATRAGCSIWPMTRRNKIIWR